MKKPVIIIIIAALVIVTLAGAAWWYFRSQSQAGSPAAYDEKPILVRTLEDKKAAQEASGLQPAAPDSTCGTDYEAKSKSGLTFCTHGTD